MACGMDYVELGIRIVQDIEDFYDNNQADGIIEVSVQTP